MAEPGEAVPSAAGFVASNNALSDRTVSPLSMARIERNPLAGAVALGANPCAVVLALPVETSVNVMVVSAWLCAVGVRASLNLASLPTQKSVAPVPKAPAAR